MDVLITGASGFLGSSFQRLFEKEHNVAGTYFRSPSRGLHQCDITNRQGVINLFQELNPDVVIHTAAISNPDECAENNQLAFEINRDGAANVAHASKRVGAKLLHISTSFVYSKSGIYSPNDETHPTNIYGQTKLAAEECIEEIMDDYVILRAPKVFGVNEGQSSGEITSHILKEMNSSGKIKLDDKTKRFPVFVDDIVIASQRLLDINANGTYHIGTHISYTKYEFGKLVADVFELEGEIVPQNSNPTANRPSGVELDTTSLEQLGINITPVENALKTIRNQRACSFKAIYSFKPDELIEGESASKIRADLGKQLGRLHDSDADIVVPIPESGIYPATGYSDQTGIPLYHGIIRDYETEKTLYEPNIEDRTRKLRKKLVAVEDILSGQSIVLVDEAIISGLTLATTIDKCHSAGAAEIHVRIPSPPMRQNCGYGILADDADLVANESSMDRNDIQSYLESKFNLASLRFLPISEFQDTIPSDYSYNCVECFKNPSS